MIPTLGSAWLYQYSSSFRCKVPSHTGIPIFNQLIRVFCLHSTAINQRTIFHPPVSSILLNTAVQSISCSAIKIVLVHPQASTRTCMNNPYFTATEFTKLSRNIFLFPSPLDYYNLGTAHKIHILKQQISLSCLPGHLIVQYPELGGWHDCAQ